MTTLEPFSDGMLNLSRSAERIVINVNLNFEKN